MPPSQTRTNRRLHCLGGIFSNFSIISQLSQLHRHRINIRNRSCFATFLLLVFARKKRPCIRTRGAAKSAVYLLFRRQWRDNGKWERLYFEIFPSLAVFLQSSRLPSSQSSSIGIKKHMRWSPRYLTVEDQVELQRQIIHSSLSHQLIDKGVSNACSVLRKHGPK